ncbi:MAG: VCBS repeat-containing protein, partial [Saprospiraceae bacterium]|nr:VCBS repeat-containing protein [Saprospiraceae bacterium]
AAFGDIDGDGDRDLLLTSVISSVSIVAKLYRNEGNNSFSEVTGTPFEGTAGGSVHFFHVDRDGDLDVLITGTNSASAATASLYINQGSGDFVKKTDAPFEGIVQGQAAIRDVDRDGDSDVLIYGENGSGDHIAKLYLNDGWGYFNEMPDVPFQGTVDGQVAFADLNRDGAPELLVTGQNNAGDPIAKLYINRLRDTGLPTSGEIPRNYGGAFTFYEMEGVPLMPSGPGGIMAVADVNNDDFQDLVMTGRIGKGREAYATKLYLNNGRGALEEMADAPLKGMQHGMAIFADVDKDSDQDLLMAGYFGNPGGNGAVLYLNNGSGMFVDGTNGAGMRVGGVLANRAVLADVDQDADPDLFMSGFDGKMDAMVFGKNNGAGKFTRADPPVPRLHSDYYDLADVDNDGDQDLLYGGATSMHGGTAMIKLYLNDGQGAFTEDTRSEFAGLYRGEIEFGDVDNDGDQDVAIMGRTGTRQFSGSSAKLYLNDGTGLFTEAEHQFPDYFNNYTTSMYLTFGDVDGDGDNDLLIGGYLLLNDGKGKYYGAYYSGFPQGATAPQQFMDVDGDGDTDIVTSLGSQGSKKAGVFLNNRYTGLFTIVENAPFPKLGFGSLAISDVNGDQHPDVLMTGLDDTYPKTHGENGKPLTKLFISDGGRRYDEKPGLPFPNLFNGTTTFADV